MNKPREWVLPLKTLIVNDGKGLSAWARQNREDETHVIEYVAYEALEKELEQIKLNWKELELEQVKHTEIIHDMTDERVEAERSRAARLIDALRRIANGGGYSNDLTIASDAIRAYESEGK